MIEPKRILWPTDFSDLSLSAGRHASDYRDRFNSELHVINVCDTLSIPAVMIPPDAGILTVSEPDIIEAAQKKLHDLVAGQFENASRVAQRVVVGTPWLEICNYASQEEIDLIIMPTHGLTGMRHVLLGSTAERVVQHAKCAVLVIKD